MNIGDTDFGLQVSIGVIGRVVTTGVSFLGAIVLARALGPSGYGAFYILMAIVSVLDNPITGWANACRKRFTEADFPTGDAIGSTLIGIILMSAAVFVAAALAAPLIAEHTGNENGWLLLGVLFLGVSSYIASVEILKSTARFGLGMWVQAGRDAIRVLAQIGLVAVAGLGVAGMVGGMVIANLLLLPLVFYLIGVRPTAPSMDSVRNIGRYAKSSVPNNLLSTAQWRMDILLLGFLASPSTAGNYEIALKITLPAMFIAGSAGGGIMGRVSNKRSRGEDIAADVRNNLAYVSVLAVPLFFGALTVGTPVVVTVFSSQYANAGTFIAGIAFYRLVRTQKSILVSVLNGLDRPDMNLRASLGVFLLNVVLGVGLLLAIGPIGVLVATVISEVVGYGVRIAMLTSLVPELTPFPRPLFEQIACGVCMAVVVLAARQVLPLGVWYNVAITVAVGGFAYFGLLILVSEQFRITVRSLADSTGVSEI